MTKSPPLVSNRAWKLSGACAAKPALAGLWKSGAVAASGRWPRQAVEQREDGQTSVHWGPWA